MELKSINPIEIWPFRPDSGLSLPLILYIQEKGWREIPPAPIFEIPVDIQREHNYILIDGHNRRNAALYFGVNLSCALYQINERIDVEKHRLAKFRHSSDLDVYNKLLKGYQLRKDIHRLVMQRLESSCMP